MAFEAPKSLNINFTSQLKNSRNLAIEAVLLIILSVLFYWFLIAPKHAAVSAQHDQLSKLQEQEKSAQTTKDDVQTLVSKLQNDTDGTALLDQAIPLDGKTDRLQLLLEKFAQDSNVTLGSLNVTSGSNGTVAGDKALLAKPFDASRSLKTLTASIYVIGSFSQLQSLLQKIEQSGRLMDISALTIDNATGNNLNMRITLNAYYFAP